MSIDPLVWLFIGAFVSWLILGLVYGFHAPRPARRRPEPPAVRIVTRGHIRVQHIPLATRLSEDAFYAGCYQSLLAELDKEAKDNL